MSYYFYYRNKKLTRVIRDPERDWEGNLNNLEFRNILRQILLYSIKYDYI